MFCGVYYREEPLVQDMDMSAEEDSYLIDSILSSYDDLLPDNEWTVNNIQTLNRKYIDFPKYIDIDVWPISGVQVMKLTPTQHTFGTSNVFPQPPKGLHEPAVKPVEIKVKEEENNINVLNTVPSRRRTPTNKSKPGKKRPLVKKNPATPKWMRTELQAANGRGEFTRPELLMVLMFTVKYFDNPNAYSKVREMMGEVRSRASIRRKVEKMVAQETGISGGLLLKKERRSEFRKILLDRFWKIMDSITGNCIESLQVFKAKMEEYCLQNKIARD